jgi:hypothetical protein
MIILIFFYFFLEILLSKQASFFFLEMLEIPNLFQDMDTKMMWSLFIGTHNISFY